MKAYKYLLLEKAPQIYVHASSNRYSLEPSHVPRFNRWFGLRFNTDMIDYCKKAKRIDELLRAYCIYVNRKDRVNEERLCDDIENFISSIKLIPVCNTIAYRKNIQLTNKVMDIRRISNIEQRMKEAEQYMIHFYETVGFWLIDFKQVCMEQSNEY